MRLSARSEDSETSKEPEAQHPLAVPPGAWLEVLAGFYEGLEVPLDRDRLVIGRGGGAGLLFAEVSLSRAHAAIGFNGREFFVQDLGSTNGTFLNGAKITQATLGDGDEIRLGKLTLRVTLPKGSSTTLE